MARGSDTIYSLTEAQITRFRSEGYLHLPGLLTEDEVAQLERTFQRFLAGEIPVEGRDLCDMSGTYDRPAEEFAIINVMLPRRYLPELVGDVYEQCAASVAEQLCGPNVSGVCPANAEWHSKGFVMAPESNVTSSKIALRDEHMAF